tara:strand:+ start:290 stop:1156 length:867 start_codon:yes stop_codon:yes gene_type:complete
MTFFNKKEEVIDIQFTRFGKRLMATGEFKPVYYQFFDDDIVYNSNSVAGTGFLESQNETQNRILSDTPRFKGNPNSSGLQSDGLTDNFNISSEGESSKKHYSLIDQDRILLYPLAQYESDSHEAPHLHLRSLGANLNAQEIEFLQTTGSGVYRKFPQLKVDSTYQLTRLSGANMADSELSRLRNSNNFIDLTSEKVEFLDQSSLSVTGEKMIFTLEESNSYYNLSNFELEIYEIDETTLRDNIPVPARLRRIEKIEDINKLFNIRTDQSVLEIETSFGREKNWYRTGE